MRKTFINALMELAGKDERIYLLTGDLGFSVLEIFAEKFPERFINCGLTEQNMIGVAAGLALSGKKPYVYSIIPFLTMRCFEQIRNDICYQNLDVKLIGVGEGLSYGAAGATHHSTEDISIMRGLPNMTVICPGDPIETKMIINLSVSHSEPTYIRLGKGNDPEVHLEIPYCEIGKGILMKDGKDITIIATGNMLCSARQVTDRLMNSGIDCRLISMPTIKPLDKKNILKALEETRAIFTIEEHSSIGGLGSAVADILAESDKKILFRKIALPDSFCECIGSQEYLREKNNLSVEQITNNILKYLQNEN